MDASYSYCHASVEVADWYLVIYRVVNAEWGNNTVSYECNSYLIFKKKIFSVLNNTDGRCKCSFIGSSL